MNVALDRFGGIVPRLSPHRLPEYGASIAHDAQLRNGRLEAWREPCQYATAAKSTVSFHVNGCCYLEWPYKTEVAELTPDWGRIYVTSDSSAIDGARVIEVGANCGMSYSYLGVPAPTGPLSVSGVTSCGRDVDERAYVYTFMNKWGEESAPSPASPLIRVSDSAVVNLSGFDAPPNNYSITHINVYRAASGFFAEDGKAQKPVTEYLYVGTVEAPATTYTDLRRLVDLGPALETEKVSPPPSHMRNITAIDGMIRLAGTKYNKIYMSENMEPYNWPIKYELTLDHNIIKMKAIGKLLYVTTDVKPYVIDTSNCSENVCYNVAESLIPYPDIACKYNDTAIVTPYGLAYLTPLGVGILKANAQVDIVTQSWFGEKDWANIKPETGRLGYWNGYLFLITDEASFMFNIGRDASANLMGTELVTISDKPIALQSSNVGKLFYLENRKVNIWNQGITLRPYIWESRRLTGRNDQPGVGNAEGNLWSPASAKIEASGRVGFTLKTMNGTVFSRYIPAGRVFRLPRIGRHSYYTVRLEGTAAVEFLDLGTAHWTVNSGV